MSSTIAIVVIACMSAGLGALGVLIASRVRTRDLRRPTPGAQPPDNPIQMRAIEVEFRSVELAARERTLEAAERFRNLLLSKLSHDVRTPLNSMITLSQLLADGTSGPLSADQRKYAQVIHRSSQQLLSLINDVLDLSHIEAGRLDLRMGPVDLRALIRGVGGAKEELARGKSLPLHLNPPGEPLLVDGDEERLRQVLSTLVEHAIQDTSNGFVELSAESDEAQATIRISDTGPGVIPEMRQADFDAFLTHEGARSPGPSMILAGRLVKLMGGTLNVDSAAGEGTTIALSLPRSRAADARSRAGAPPPAAHPVAGPGHVLLVEDDAIERQRVADLLVGAGYHLSVASSGQDGLNQLRAGTFDAVVLDMVMPGTTGLDVLRAARTEERLASTPFIVLSALYMTRTEREVLGPMVVAVVRKEPDNAEQLLAELARARQLRPAAAPGPDVMRAPPDRLARVLLIENDDDVHLTIEQILASLPVTVETAATAREALEICQRRPPDLILMEADLPGGSGLDVSAEIRRLPECAGVPIIALAQPGAFGGAPADPDHGAHRMAPCDAYLYKPVNAGDVVSAVTRALQLGVH